MTAVAEYIRRTYKLVQARSCRDAVAYFQAKYGYIPAPVLGSEDCTDAQPSRFVAKGYYLCAVREED